MESIYVLKPVPNTIKRLIYVYMLGIGTKTSKLIKEEYNKLDRRKKQCMMRKGDIWDSTKIIGFIGCKACIMTFFTRNASAKTYKHYESNTGINKTEDWLYDEQVYEVDAAKLFYLYHFGNQSLFQIMLNVRVNNIALDKLIKYKLLQIQKEEEMLRSIT
jgi:hypothetical protein